MKEFDRLNKHWILYDTLRRELNRWHREQLKKIKEKGRL